MSTFKSNSSSDKKNYSDFATEFYPFWKGYFDSQGIKNPIFKTKLCYPSKEFGAEELTGKKEYAISMFPSELDIEDDIYIELCDFQYSFYNKNPRILYKLKRNPHWKSEPETYVLRQAKSATQSFAVNIESLEKVSSIEVKEFVEQPIEEQPSILDSGFVTIEKEDAHIFRDATIRDLYSIMHNVPESNKDWINQMIIKNKKK